MRERNHVGTALALAAALLLAACDSDGSAADGIDGGNPIVSDGGDCCVPDGAVVPDGRPDAAEPEPDAALPATLPYACSGLYAQDLFPTFEIEIAPSEWTKLQEDYRLGQQRLEDGDEWHPNHPLIAFRYQGLTIHDAQIRLRGNPEWWTGSKMQFQIAFNEVNPDGRFVGLRKLALDAAAQNKSFLRDRLALQVLRDMGIEAPCANNARLIVNGAYYGLFTNVEKVDKEFLQRNFGKVNDNGDLWKRKDWVAQTNETTADRNALMKAWQASSPTTLCKLIDCNAAILEWAGEAVVSDADGAWAGALNFYLYAHPERGFVYIPWDLDASFDRLPSTTDPLTYARHADNRPNYKLLTADPGWRAKYIDALRLGLEKYDTPLLQARIDAWSKQINSAALADPHKQFTDDDYRAATKTIRSYVSLRNKFLTAWLAAQPPAN